MRDFREREGDDMLKAVKQILNIFYYILPRRSTADNVHLIYFITLTQHARGLITLTLG